MQGLIGVKGDSSSRSLCAHQNVRNFNDNRILRQIYHEELTHGFVACARMLNVLPRPEPDLWHNGRKYRAIHKKPLKINPLQKII